MVRIIQASAAKNVPMEHNCIPMFQNSMVYIIVWPHLPQSTYFVKNLGKIFCIHTANTTCGQQHK